MKSPNIFNQNDASKISRSSGMTLIEIIIAMSIMSAVLAFGLMINSNSYQNDSFRANRDLLVASLQRTRLQAINNICIGDECSNGKPHGVHIETDDNGFVKNYAIFQGSSYDPSDPIKVIIKTGNSASANLSLLEWSAREIRFNQLSGDSSGGIIKLSNGEEDSTININTEGAIEWTN